jgi:hypothetical protein
LTTKRSFPSNLQVLTVDDGRIERCLDSVPKGRACLPHVDRYPHGRFDELDAARDGVLTTRDFDR